MSDSPSSSTSIPARLRQLRLDQGVKQKDLAEMLDLGYSVMSAYENGVVSPQLDVVYRWADVFGLQLDLVPNGGRAPVRKVAPKSTTYTVELSQYQVALAMGMLIAASREATGQMSADLQDVANALARALSG